VSRVAAIGDGTALAGYALVGVDVRTAVQPDQVHRAWELIEPDVALVLLTADACRALGPALEGTRVLWAVLPE